MMRAFGPASILVTVLLTAIGSTPATAQAWVGERGELSVALRTGYQTAGGVWHGSTLVTGIPAQAIHTALAAEYVPIERLAIGLAINMMGTRYSGPQSIPGSMVILAHGSQDDGDFHWNLTDLDLDARFQAYSGAVTLSPLLRAKVPVTDYEQKGYAASGSGLWEVGAGLALGRHGLGLEDLVLQASYTFTFVGKESGGGTSTEMFRVNRSDADLSLAYLVNDKLAFALGTAFRYTHDGFDLEDYPGLPPGHPLRTWHDPVLAARYFAVTAAASYRITEAFALSAHGAAIVWGRNASNAITFGLGVEWATNLVD